MFWLPFRRLYKSTQKPSIWKLNTLILWALYLELLNCVNQIQTDYIPARHNSIKTYIFVIFLLHFSIPPPPSTSLRAMSISTLSKKNSNTTNFIFFRNFRHSIIRSFSILPISYIFHSRPRKGKKIYSYHSNYSFTQHSSNFHDCQLSQPTTRQNKKIIIINENLPGSNVRETLRRKSKEAIRIVSLINELIS